jgi:hypothetical protein
MLRDLGGLSETLQTQHQRAGQTKPNRCPSLCQSRRDHALRFEWRGSHDTVRQRAQSLPRSTCCATGCSPGSEGVMTEARIPPHDEEIESAVIASVLLFGHKFESITFLTPEHFFDRQNRTFFEVFWALYDEGTPIDLSTVANRLRSDGRFYDNGGFEAVRVKLAAVAQAGNVVPYATRVLELHVRRAIIEAAQRAEARAHLGHAVDDILTELDERVWSLQKLRERIPLSPDVQHHPRFSNRKRRLRHDVLQ